MYKTMTIDVYNPRSFEDFHMGFNDISIEALFAKYEDIGFLYAAKKKLLSPFFDKIQHNWEQLLQSQEELLWILNKEDLLNEHFASISVWKNSNKGLLAQHLVSTGNPFLSLEVMLAAQFRTQHHLSSEEVISSQNWFRPNNRYAYRVFASMYDKLGPSRSSLIKFQYLHLDLAEIRDFNSCPYEVKEYTHADAGLTLFICRQLNPVFVQAEELDQADLTLSCLGQTFEAYGLERSRKVFTFCDPDSQKILACIVANRAPLGLNFSFLENRAYYIVDKDLDIQQKDALLRSMSQVLKSYYSDFPLQVIPIVTDVSSSHILQSQGARFLREYMQSIWLREGFSLWYDHILSFLRRIEGRRQAA